MTTFEGKLERQGLKFALVVGRFNEFISQPLVRRGPGLPAAPRVADATWTRPGCRAPSRCRWRPAHGRQRQYDAVICLGAVIRGGTPHFDYVAGEAAKGIAKVIAGYAACR